MATDAEQLHLDRQLCFAVYAASRAITSTYRPLLGKLALTYPQYLVMLALWEESPLSVGEIGQRLQLDSGTLSPLLKRLECDGLLDRSRRPDDERVVSIALTPEGRELRALAEDVPDGLADAMRLGPDEIAELRNALRELTESLAQNDPEDTI